MKQTETEIRNKPRRIFNVLSSRLGMELQKFNSIDVGNNMST